MAPKFQEGEIIKSDAGVIGKVLKVHEAEPHYTVAYKSFDGTGSFTNTQHRVPQHYLRKLEEIIHTTEDE